MILALPADVVARLEANERREGVPVLEQCHEAIAVWSQLQTEEQRKAMTFNVLRSSLAYLLEPRDAGASH